MIPALGAIGALSGLLSALSSSSSSTKTTSLSNPFEPSSAKSSDSSSLSTPASGGSSASGGLSPELMQALLAAQQGQSADPTTTKEKSRDAALKDLFAQLDGNGDGAISKGEFESALGAGGTNTANADKVFAKLDTDGDGSVSAKELAAALQSKKKAHHHDGSQQAGNGSGDPLQALTGASSTSVTNSDGTVTTSVTYADGSKVSMTSAAGASSSKASSSYNFVEQLIQRQANQVQSAATSTVSIKA
ncbi:EF-hand domain-containing protein [Rhodopseudomonas sp. HC1]|uniref:EF-hand domain-containing protein n=1 Tax=Rhodopseudomonas infernalis TaxID=2897386 RepID=UPI001EE8D995|nr:EF-hand domain-containing protein [Rhodopseudomonas infernalis]MCG6204475.1 EF-hand domain-containing protein [Rhodopseudomonas infernalis]